MSTPPRNPGMKLPIVRAIPAALQLSQGFHPVPIVLHVTDMRLGLDRHSVTVMSKYGEPLIHTGTLSGVTFHEQERRGAPPKLGRDMALRMALHLYLCGNKMSEAQARQKVLELWSCNDWRGIPDESALNKKLHKADAEISRSQLSFFAADFGESEKSVVVLADQSAFDLKPREYARAKGEGWVWHYGMERATFCAFSFNERLFPPG